MLGLLRLSISQLLGPITPSLRTLRSWKAVGTVVRNTDPLHHSNLGETCIMGKLPHGFGVSSLKWGESGDKNKK